MHTKALPQLLRAAVFGSIVLLSSAVSAKRDGQNMPCPVCHEGMDGPKLTFAFDPALAMVGQTVRVNVTATHAKAVVGGVFVDSLGKGEMKVLEGTQTRIIMPGQGTHSEPHPYLNGEVKFAFDWVAPAEPGTARFEVWSNAGNDNRMPADDSPSHVFSYIAYGCTGVWYYPDADVDGFGDEAQRELACEPIAGRITQGGDCDAASPAAAMVHPGVTEICNGADDNCDGQIDEGFTPQRLTIDVDADGFGALGGVTKMGCPPVMGFAPTAGDCDDANPAINPKVTETPNGIDDNCDSQIDEKPSMNMGGSGGSGQPGGGSSSGPGAAPANDGGGCSMQSRHGRFAPAALGLAALLLARRGWRRRARRLR